MHNFCCKLRNELLTGEPNPVDANLKYLTLALYREGITLPYQATYKKSGVCISSEETLLGNSHVCTGFNKYYARFSLSEVKLFFSRLSLLLKSSHKASYLVPKDWCLLIQTKHSSKTLLCLVWINVHHIRNITNLCYKRNQGLSNCFFSKESYFLSIGYSLSNKEIMTTAI